jgi:hypothetical protein
VNDDLARDVRHHGTREWPMDCTSAIPSQSTPRRNMLYDSQPTHRRLPTHKILGHTIYAMTMRIKELARLVAEQLGDVLQGQ